MKTPMHVTTLAEIIAFAILSAGVLGGALLTITRRNPVTAVMSLVFTFCALAGLFATLSAHFLAVLQVLVYAGAIMVLFVFVVMMLNLGAHSVRAQRQWLRPAVWIGPSILAAVLLAELVYVLAGLPAPAAAPVAVGPQAVGLALFGPYVLAAELASIMLLAGLVGAYHLARPEIGGPAEGEA